MNDINKKSCIKVNNINEIAKNLDTNIKKIHLKQEKIPILEIVVSRLQNLIILNCSNLRLTNLNCLPTNLRELDCSNNKITSLDMLPLTLIKLRCSNNNISKLEHLSELTHLDCSNNNIDELDNLPSSLTYLKCSENNITKLNNLPFLLKFLNCTDNKLTTLDNLPCRLKYLCCDKINTLESLDNLPNSLLYLSCDKINIDKIIKFPPKLEFLSCKNNKILIMNLPSSIKEIHINKIENIQSELEFNYDKLIITHVNSKYHLEIFENIVIKSKNIYEKRKKFMRYDIDNEYLNFNYFSDDLVYEPFYLKN